MWKQRRRENGVSLALRCPSRVQARVRLLLPEQQRSNNPNGCFNWFEPEDTRRGGGEAASIQAMIEKMVRENGIDPRRVFITGLSAGGAMTSVMLAW